MHARKRVFYGTGRSLLGLVLAAFLACGPTAGLSAGEASGSRVISIGGDITEIVYALQAEDRLVAVDSTSRYPDAAQELPDVGYMRRLSAEAILSLRPSLVLATEDAGPPSALDQLQAAGVEVSVIADEPSPAGVAAKIERVAGLLDLPERGAVLADDVSGRFDALERSLANVASEPRVMLLLSAGRGAPMTAGADTAADAIIRLSHGVNAARGFTGYKPLSPEAMIEAAPDVFLVTDRTLDLIGGEAALLKRPEVASTPAARHSRVVVMDGLLLLGFGPRTPKAVAQLAKALHPQVELTEAVR